MAPVDYGDLIAALNTLESEAQEAWDFNLPDQVANDIDRARKCLQDHSTVGAVNYLKDLRGGIGAYDPPPGFVSDLQTVIEVIEAGG